MSAARILFVLANPKDQDYVKAAAEADAIRVVIEAARLAEEPQFEVVPDVTARRLADTLSRFHPDIVHFSGHGNPQGLAFMNDSDSGESQPISPKILADIFGAVSRPRLVFLNACNSDSHAKSLSKHADCVIGLRGDVSDAIAIKLASGFYATFAEGHSVQSAFRVSLAILKAAGHSETAENVVLETRVGVYPQAIHLTHGARKGDVLRLDSALWDNYLIVLDFGKHIHHEFQILKLRHVNTMVRESDNLARKYDPVNARSFSDARNNHDDEYKEFTANLQAKFQNNRQTVLAAFAILEACPDPFVCGIIGAAKDYYRTIEQHLEKYAATQVQLTNCLHPQAQIFAILINRKNRSAINHYCSELQRNAAGLMESADNLIKRLIEFPLADRNEDSQ